MIAQCAVLAKAHARWKQLALATANTSSTPTPAPSAVPAKQLAQWVPSQQPNLFSGLHEKLPADAGGFFYDPAYSQP
jgi:hypothetical protein